MPQLFTLAVPDGTLTQVTKGEYAVVDFDWAPDGASFALVTATTQLLYDAMTAASVRVVDRAGATLARSLAAGRTGTGTGDILARRTPGRVAVSDRGR